MTSTYFPKVWDEPAKARHKLIRAYSDAHKRCALDWRSVRYYQQPAQVNDGVDTAKMIAALKARHLEARAAANAVYDEDVKRLGL